MNAELRHDNSKVVALVLLAKQGDQKACGELFELFRPAVKAAALRVLRNHSEAADLEQEVFLRMVDKIEQLREPEAFAGWLRQMTVNMAYNLARRRDVAAGGQCNRLLDSVAGRDDGSADNVVDEELREQLHLALARLRPHDRAVLVAHYFEHKLLKRMARELDLPLGTVKRRLHVARKRLAALMAEAP